MRNVTKFLATLPPVDTIPQMMQRGLMMIRLQREAVSLGISNTEFWGRAEEDSHVQQCARTQAAQLALWAQSGFPAVEVGHRLAAALACTNPPDEHRAPWSTFLAYVPSGLIAMASLNSVPIDRPRAAGYLEYGQEEVSGEHVSHVLVHTQWPYITLDVKGTRGSGYVFADRYSVLVDKHCLQDRPSYERDHYSPDREVLSQHERTLRCVISFVSNLCSAMSEPHHVRRVGKGRCHDPFSSSRPAAAHEPKTQLFRLGTPVRVDCRDAVRSYTNGTTRSLASVRWLVRGHWTHQPCGPGRVERRLQWIEPYWKGDASLPINVRPHQLVDNEHA